MDFPSPAPTPATNDSAPSSTPSTPEPLLDDDNDFFLVQRNESQSSFGPPSSDEGSLQPPARERPKAPIESLPSELLISILARVGSPPDLFNCLMVSRGWSRCCVDLLWHRPLFTTWDKLRIVAESIGKPDPYWPYADLVRRLNLSNLSAEINDGTLQPFRDCKRVERLTLTGCKNLTDQAIITLVEGNRYLLAVDLTSIESITDSAVQALSRNCPRLQGLNTTGCKNLTDDSLVSLAASCKYLKRLKLNKCGQITEESIHAFARYCPLMLEIDLLGCEHITDSAVRSLLQSARYLRELRLAQCHRVTDNAILSISPDVKFEALRILDLTGCVFLTDLAVERIVDSAPRLRILVLAKCLDITDRAVHAITKLGKNLHDIHLGRCGHITDDAVKELVRCCNRIRYIDLAGCNRVTDASVKLLSTLPKLRRIGLVKCHNITDRSILALAKNNFDPRNPRAVATSNLERVHLSYCHEISIPGIHELLNSCLKLTHLSLTGIQAFFHREDLLTFCREAPAEFTDLLAEFTDDQRTVFCVFSGDGVNKLRDYLNQHEESRRAGYVQAVANGFDESMDEQDGINGMMQSAALDGEDYDE